MNDTNTVSTVAATEKREYTPRGTTHWCKRVVLFDDEPNGRGSPELAEMKNRKVVYIPEDMEFDPAIHLQHAKKFNAETHKAPFRRIAKSALGYEFDNGVQPTIKAVKKVTKKVAKKTPAKVTPAVAPEVAPAKKAVKRVRAKTTVVVEPSAQVTEVVPTEAVTA